MPDIAQLNLQADRTYLGVVRDFVVGTAVTAGLEQGDAHNLNALLLEICENTIAYGYEGKGNGSLIISVAKDGEKLVVSVEDQGVPFDYRRLETGGDKRFSRLVNHQGADHIRFVNLGPGGNRVELVHVLPTHDVREEADEAEHEAVVNAPAADPDENLDLRLLTPDDAIDLARAVYRCYGYSYDCEFVYFPEQVKSRIWHGRMVSCGVYNRNNDLVGHLALTFNHDGMRVAEAGQAVVDPRYRGHGLFKRMKLFLRDYAAGHNVVGLYSEAVTVHPYSQQGNLALGAHEVGYLLGYSPGNVSFRAIAEEQESARRAIALMYMPVLDPGKKQVHIPEAYRDVASGIYGNLNLPRVVEDEIVVSRPRLPDHSVIAVNVRNDHNQGVIEVEVYGADAVQVVRGRLRELCMRKVDCIYLDLPLNNPAVVPFGESFRSLGFFFGGIIPEFSLQHGDVLRMQYLNNIVVNPEEIAVASDFGRALLESILTEAGGKISGAET